MNQDKQSEVIERLRELLAKATGQQYGTDDRSRPLPWEVWTSCSFRRVKTGRHQERGDLDVLSAYRCSDGGLDLSMPEDRLIALVEIVNALPSLLEALSRPSLSTPSEGVIERVRAGAIEEAAKVADQIAQIGKVSPFWNAGQAQMFVECAERIRALARLSPLPLVEENQ